MLYRLSTDGPLERHLGQEWLLTNGLGAFASSTVVGCNTRRYHGLLCAATLPPVGRVLMLSRLGELLHLDGNERPTYEFSVNQFGSDFHPRGDQHLRAFACGDSVRFEYDVEGTRIVKEIQLLWQTNAVLVRYGIDPGRHSRVRLTLLPMCALRDFHAAQHDGQGRFESSHQGLRVNVKQGKWELFVQADGGEFQPHPHWWRNHTYAVEAERGLGDREDLWCPGRFVFETQSAATLTLWASLEPRDRPDWDAELQRRRAAIAATYMPPKKELSPTLQRLHHAANDFVVARQSPDGQPGTTILAGYPWFSDWGRDSMISLPGLLLTTGRYAQARQVLGVFARYVSEGMIPNRFDDYNNEPHYNTVDASLWFVHACFEYLRHTADHHSFNDVLLPACRQIIDGYRRGTRFNIHMDERDGLISQGGPDTQLTWMDAKCDGVVFTPRHGKAVEINALWHNALMLMGEMALAARAAAGFRKAFWLNSFRGLADVARDNWRDVSIRPNQIFAVSLPHSPLEKEQARTVVEVVRRELLTPVGLRTLAAGESGYRGRFTGPPRQRDEAYHNGTVWPWLIGAFLEAHLRVNDFSDAAKAQARQWLQPLIASLETEGCIGQISETYDGDEPRRPGGCCAQAWSVAEVLRLADMLEM